MNTLAALRSALRALAANPLRSILTMLGIIIGVAAVITMIAIGRGAQSACEEQIKSLGTNMHAGAAGAVTQGGVRLGAQTGQALTEDDAKAIARRGARGAGGRAVACAPACRWWRRNANWARRFRARTPTTSRCATGRSPSGRNFEPGEDAGSARSR